MSRATVTRRGATRFPGIGAIALQMGIRRETLYRYLAGKWTMPATTRKRYERAVATHNKSTAA